VGEGGQVSVRLRGGWRAARVGQRSKDSRVNRLMAKMQLRIGGVGLREEEKALA